MTMKKQKEKKTIIDSRCPYCGNDKAFFSPRYGRKCTKCKQRY